MKSFVNPFDDIALTFFDSSFNLFLYKPVFFTKLAMQLLLAKIASGNLAVKFATVHLSNFWAVIYLS